jgi:hypothetical protein
MIPLWRNGGQPDQLTCAARPNDATHLDLAATGAVQLNERMRLEHGHRLGSVDIRRKNASTFYF